MSIAAFKTVFERFANGEKAPELTEIKRRDMAELYPEGMQIEFDEDNPRRHGSAAAMRYDNYKYATSVGEALGAGATYTDIDQAVARGHARIS